MGIAAVNASTNGFSLGYILSLDCVKLQIHRYVPVGRIQLNFQRTSNSLYLCSDTNDKPDALVNKEKDSGTVCCA